MVDKYASLYSRATTRQRQKIYREAAATLGRSLESVKKVIRIARKELEAKQESAK
jgi:DNA-directed RNA polymerase specialized sigma24 family protein